MRDHLKNASRHTFFTVHLPPVCDLKQKKYLPLSKTNLIWTSVCLHFPSPTLPFSEVRLLQRELHSRFKFLESEWVFIYHADKLKKKKKSVFLTPNFPFQSNPKMSTTSLTD